MKTLFFSTNHAYLIDDHRSMTPISFVWHYSWVIWTHSSIITFSFMFVYVWLSFCFDRQIHWPFENHVSTNSCFLFAQSFIHEKRSKVYQPVVRHKFMFIFHLFIRFFPLIFSLTKIHSWKSHIHPKWSEWLCVVLYRKIICAFFDSSNF